MSFIGLSDPAVQTGVGITAINLSAGVATAGASTTSVSVAVPNSTTSSVYVASWISSSIIGNISWTDSISISATSTGFTANFGSNVRDRQFSWSKMT